MVILGLDQAPHALGYFGFTGDQARYMSEGVGPGCDCAGIGWGFLCRFGLLWGRLKGGSGSIGVLLGSMLLLLIGVWLLLRWIRFLLGWEDWRDRGLIWVTACVV